MRKRGLAIILSVMMAASALAGCGRKASVEPTSGETGQSGTQDTETIKETEKPEQTGPKTEYSDTKAADVVIIGAGGAGLSAALEAVENGAGHVIILEMTGSTGGALNYTSGSMSAAETTVQKEDKIEDTKESFVEDIMRTGSDFGGKPNKKLVELFVEEDTDTFQWLWEQGLSGYTFSTDAQGRRAVFAPEHALYSVPRTYKTRAKDPKKYKSAAHELLDSMVQKQDKITIEYNTKAVELAANEKGQVLSVIGRHTEDETATRYDAKKGIIVATGGYSSNKKMMEQYVENGASYLAGGGAGADGNGLLLMQNVGGAIHEESMSYIPTFPMGLESRDNPGTGTIASTYTWKAGGIVVNQEGKRFVNETDPNPAIREIALEEQTNAIQYDIFTDNILEDLRAAKASNMYDMMFASEGAPGNHALKEAATLGELAGMIGVPPEALEETVKAYNASVEAGGTDEFGRSYTNEVNAYQVGVNKIEGNKFYAVPLKALCVMTLGGITVNDQMQVVDQSGQAIPGLYAAGEVVGGIWGKFVSGGTGVMGPIVFGRLTARNVMNLELMEGYEVKPADNLLDPALFEKDEDGNSDFTFDMTKPLKDGEYQAVTDGQEGPMTVKVVISGGSIAAVEILDHSETEAIAGAAFDKVPGEMVAQNSPDVDGTSGATLTSNRIKKAVILCLLQAAE